MPVRGVIASLMMPVRRAKPRGEIEMAKCNVTHACGHTSEHNLFGPYKERDRRAQWLAGQDCPTCEAERREAAKRAANAAATQAAQEAGLPELLGSEKQIAWAESIRLKALGEAQEAIEKNANTPERRAQVAPLMAQLKGENSAAWWIDNRSKSGVELLKGMAR
jgi:hypothetical protein